VSSTGAFEHLETHELIEAEDVSPILEHAKGITSQLPDSYQGESRMLDSLEGVCPGQARFEYPATSVLFSNSIQFNLRGPAAQVDVGIERPAPRRRAGGSNRAPWAGSTGLRISAAPPRAGDTGRAGWAAGRVGLHPDQLPGRVGAAGRHRRWGPAGPGVDPSPVREWVAWRQPSCSPRRRPPAGNAMATPHPAQCGACPSPDSPQPVQLRRQRPGAVLQILAGRRGWRTAGRGRGTPSGPVAGLRVHGRASSSLGQQVHLRPFWIPDPGGMLISPGRPVFWRVASRFWWKAGGRGLPITDLTRRG
jgi:hypothetical protein